jgi:hypothetical protein
MNPKIKPAPSPDQLAAVAAYAARHGRTWRAALMDAWLTGRDAQEPAGHLLRQVRNTCGPAWLATVTMADLAPEEPAAPSCPHCGRDLETDAELAAGLCTSDDCPRHDPAADRLAATLASMPEHEVNAIRSAMAATRCAA